MESFNIQDLPDNWYDVIYKEGNDFLYKMNSYPRQLGMMVAQVIMQTMIYNTFKKDVRESFLVNMLDAFIEQFDMWEVEDRDSQDGEI